MYDALPLRVEPLLSSEVFAGMPRNVLAVVGDQAQFFQQLFTALTNEDYNEQDRRRLIYLGRDVATNFMGRLLDYEKHTRPAYLGNNQDTAWLKGLYEKAGK